LEKIKLSEYTYNLSPEKIASYGLKKRDHSKLLFYSNGQINHYNFFQLKDLIPPKASLFFNNTKVIQARLFLKRNTGAVIEVFLLSPSNPSLSIYNTLDNTTDVSYKCMIGNLKKWQENEILTKEININGKEILLNVNLSNKKNKVVDFSWKSSDVTFGEIIDAIGHTPLPPYIKRADDKNDKKRYQTIYSKLPGAVAAPTAGLHFTNEVLNSLVNKGIKLEQLTLHVSAGTFQPIKVEKVSEHPMHSEQIIITTANIKAILSAKYRIAVGTTAMRTLESTYWYGVQILLTNKTAFQIDKLSPYQYDSQELPDLHKSLNAILSFMHENNLETMKGDTEIFIMPGYKFKVCQGLITNFHQPGSTLILLVAAFIGEKWKDIYHEALHKNYRFLSYGDSSLLLP